MYGKFSWEAMGADGPVAEVRGAQPSQGAASGWTANVVINASGSGGWFDLGGARAWYGGYYSRNELNAKTVIHELGHVFEFMFSANTTSILNDSQSSALSHWNSDLVMTSCFGWRGN